MPSYQPRNPRSLAHAQSTTSDPQQAPALLRPRLIHDVDACHGACTKVPRQDRDRGAMLPRRINLSPGFGQRYARSHPRPWLTVTNNFHVL